MENITMKGLTEEDGKDKDNWGSWSHGLRPKKLSVSVAVPPAPCV
jgi:hypothetical protein